MKRFIASVSLASLTLLGLAIPSVPALAAPVTVQASGGELKPANTSRKIVVASNGDIFVLFNDTTSGVSVAKSTDGGATFGSPVVVDSTTAEAEIAISNAGTLYVTWAQSGVIYQKRSTDSGATWNSAVTVATYPGDTVHTAVDREYVYVIPRDGKKVFSSADSGDVWRSTDLSANRWAFSDISVDPLTGRIHPFVDNPNVSWYYSDDRGVTFSSEQTTGKQVFYSVAAISSSPTTKYLFMAGGGTNLERLNLLTTSVDSFNVLDAAGQTYSQSRSLAADAMGNVVSSVMNTAGALTFQVSNDFGASFSAATTVANSVSQGAMTINPTNGDVLVLWQEGSTIKFEKFSGLLVGYDLNLDVSALDFDSAGNKTIVLTNTSATAITVSEIVLSNTTDFSETNTCTSALAQNASCTITVTATNAGSAILTIRATGGIERFIPIAFGASSATIVAPAVTSSDSRGVPPAYTGPIVNPLSSPVEAGSKVRFTGVNLATVSEVTIDGKSATVVTISDTEFEVTIPSGISGLFDITVTGDNGTVTVQAAVSVSGTASGSSSAGVKRTADSARIYYFNPVNAGKVQFFLNDKEIAWVNATSASDSKLLSVLKAGSQTPYLVRTVDLKPGKNIIEVYLDGERVKRVAYTR